MKRILFLTTVLPFSKNTGGFLRSRNIASFLSKHFDVLMLGMDQAFIPVGNSIFSKTEVRAGAKKKPLRKDFHYSIMSLIPPARPLSLLRSFFTDLPFTVSRYCAPSVYRQIQTAAGQFKPDLIYSDHIHVAEPALGLASKSGVPVILDSHNVDSLLFKRLSLTCSFEYFFILEYIRFLKLEKKLLPSFDLVLATSSIDRLRLMARGARRVEVVENFIHHFPPSLPIPGSSSSSCSLLFVGDLAWFPNRQGLLKFITETTGTRPVKNINSEPLELYVLSRTEMLLPESSFLKIKFLNDEENISQIYAKADAAIVPLQAGSGTRIKILEALAHGVPVYSTMTGAEGIRAGEKEGIKRFPDIKSMVNYLILSHSSGTLAAETRNLAKLAATRGREFIKKFHLAGTVCRKVVELAQELIETRRSSQKKSG